ncbi:MAG: nickel-dependent lactate racemase [Desulfovibrio sp.]|jgi:nickel-dependent lactate racemase|nr:nickel-dependent lactate racemase [Desulfovibrio sp.]
MRLHLRYGRETLPLWLQDTCHVDIFEPNTTTALDDPIYAIKAALDAPLGCQAFNHQKTPRSVAIAVPDKTRPFPLKLLLPPFLDRLFATWPSLEGKDVCIVVGGGLHPPADAEQLNQILPENLYGCRVVSHDAVHSPVLRVGVTSRGNPVEINADYIQADMKIVLGMVDAHQFVGFTGGAKGAIIGCGSAAAIAANHRLLRESASVIGNIENNPARLDINEAGDLAGINFAVNVVLDKAKQPVAIFAGLPSLVMSEASRVTAKVYGMSFGDPYDIVVASCGGSPKDICLYQAQKGLATAAQCAAAGAKILLVAKCEEGVGDERYYEYVRRFSDAQALMSDFKTKPFVVGPHKAFLFARALAKFTVVVQSEIPAATLADCLLTYGRLQETVDKWLAEKPNARVAVITNANSTFFGETPPL